MRRILKLTVIVPPESFSGRNRVFEYEREIIDLIPHDVQRIDLGGPIGDRCLSAPVYVPQPDAFGPGALRRSVDVYVSYDKNQDVNLANIIAHLKTHDWVAVPT
jgi:hypothetical protein